MTAGRPRTYRRFMPGEPDSAFRLVVEESDLYIHAPAALFETAKESLIRHRERLKRYIEGYPAFLSTLSPWPADETAPLVVREMIAAGRAAGVGPMAAVAGAVAEAVGRDLAAASPRVVVENGGDLFVAKTGPVTVGIFAGSSPLSMKVGVRVEANGSFLGICTSSGRVGHSLSFGAADAACVVSDRAALADAAATAVANRVQKQGNMTAAIDYGRQIPGISGIVVIRGKRMAAWGNVSVVPLSRKKG